MARYSAAMKFHSSISLTFFLIIFLAASPEHGAAQQREVPIKDATNDTKPTADAKTIESASHSRYENATNGDRMKDFRRHFRGPFMHVQERDATERKRLRAALQAVLDDPAVAQARDDLRAASEHLKATLRSAIAERDPQLAPMLADMLSKTPPGRPIQQPGNYANKGGHGAHWQTGGGRDAFAGSPIQFLQGEVLRRALEAHRRELREAHDIVMKHPDIQATINELSTAQPGSPEQQALRDTLRKSYLAEMKKHLPGLAQSLQQEPRHPRARGHAAGSEEQTPKSFSTDDRPRKLTTDSGPLEDTP